MPERITASIRDRTGPFRVPPPGPADAALSDAAPSDADLPDADLPDADLPNAARSRAEAPARPGSGSTLGILAARARQLASTGPLVSPARAARSGRFWPRADVGPLGGSYVTVRGAVVAMFGIFFLCTLVAGWLSLGILIGLGYAACCIVAPFFVRRHALVHIIITPPAIFLVAVILTQILTAQGTTRHGRVLSVLEGTVLTLAAVAPWLLAGSALGVAGAMTRGLAACVRQLAAELRGDAAEVPAPRKG
jgi:hypothetical protein